MIELKGLVIGCFPSYYFMTILPNACTHSYVKKPNVYVHSNSASKSPCIQHKYHWKCLKQYYGTRVCALDLVMTVVLVEVRGLKQCNINVGECDGDNDKRRHIMMMGGK